MDINLKLSPEQSRALEKAAAEDGISMEEAALRARSLAREEGVFAGYTSGAAIQGLLQYNELGYFDKDSVIVVILPDHGSRYLSKIYNEQWMKDQGFTEQPSETVVEKGLKVD